VVKSNTRLVLGGHEHNRPDDPHPASSTEGPRLDEIQSRIMSLDRLILGLGICVKVAEALRSFFG
jgi:hypothetical protein